MNQTHINFNTSSFTKSEHLNLCQLKSIELYYLAEKYENKNFNI